MDTNKKTFSQLEYELNAMQTRLAELQRIVNCGVPKSKAHLFDIPPLISSGYSMGERVFINVNGIEIATRDWRQYYAKSCTWREKHGLIVVNLTKKQLKAYIDMRQDERMQLLYNCIDETKSIIKKQ